MTELADIDQQIVEARRDAMALEIDGMKVNFFMQIAQLKAEGSRILKQLARVTGMPLVYDIYTARTVEAGTSNTLYMVLG